ncbi:hypothetical protein FSP39_000350 [Pinctada imbricata]|uniref:Cyclic nucleotide-binding domain-containing protein n=1 Tax=Pinctada imbricata TaxID=66713 RepID=A0AA88YSY6_PINIB|nr:hypothetical protein FSP39_000350 [Pinctada imbricata]
MFQEYASRTYEKTDTSFNNSVPNYSRNINLQFRDRIRRVIQRSSEISEIIERIFGGHITAKGQIQLHEVVQSATETQKFYEETERTRQLEAAKSENDEKDLPPVFNKRLFATQGTVIITKEARRIMSKNADVPPEVNPALSKSELQTMRSVVDGLKLIHRGQDYVKDVISRCATLETYNAFSYVVRKPWEDSLSCYYLVHGAVEVTYDMGGTAQSSSRNVYQPNIIYSHGTGEYLGIVSAEGRDEDIAPPATIYTKELCEFIRIDRERFHRICEREQAVLYNEISNYLLHGQSVLSSVADDVKTKILHLMQKQEFPPNRTILEQDELSNHLYIVASGRCQCFRKVYIPESDKAVLFYLCSREKDESFGDECILDGVGSIYQVKTSTHVVVYRLHRTAMKIVNYDKLTKILEENRQEFTSDEELRDRGYKDTMWKNYKHNRVKEPLIEHGKLKYLCTKDETPVIERPPTPQEQKTENMFRFVLKGAQYTAYRPRSAHLHRLLRDRSSMSNRPQSASSHIMTTDQNESQHEESDSESDNGEQQNTMLMSKDMAQKLEELYEKHKDSKDMMMKMFDEDSELGQHIKKAWEKQEQGETEKEGFIKNGVLATMESDDIVRKAMAMADKHSYLQKRRNMKHEEEWDTVLHAENKQAKFLITANKMRISVLRKKLDDIEKQRNFNIQKRKDAKERTNALKCKENKKQLGGGKKDTPKNMFILDKLKNEKYLTKEEADSKGRLLRPSSAILTKAEEASYLRISDSGLGMK